MREGLIGRHPGEPLAVEAPEGPARAGEPDPRERALGLPLEALEDGGVLRIDGQDLPRPRGPHDEAPGRDEAFLVGEGDALAGLEGGERGAYGGRADDGDDDRVDVGKQRQVLDGAFAVGEARPLGKPRERIARRALAMGEREVCDPEFPGDPDEPSGVASRSQGHDLQLVGMLAADVERLAPDGARAAEDADPEPPLAQSVPSSEAARPPFPHQRIPPRWSTR